VSVPPAKRRATARRSQSFTPSDSTFRLLLAQLDVEGFEGLLQQWMAAQPGVTETVDNPGL
jgi:hypothetical protein